MEYNGWISVGESLPQSGQEVLTYFYDEPFDIDQFQILTYYKKGDKFDCEDITNGDLINQIFGKYDRLAKEDGFYIYDCIDGENTRYRKHADIITHWRPLRPPSQII